MEGKRIFARMGFNTKVEWRKADNEKSSGEFSSKNISGGGICLIVDDTVRVGDKLLIELELPTGKRIKTKVNVTWIESVDGFEVLDEEKKQRLEAGVEFIEISTEHRDEIMNSVIDIYGNRKRQQKT